MRHLVSFRYIDRIVRTGSIRGAAEYLAISPSALNRRILAFEDELGVPIFERLPSGVRLSTAGEILYRHIQTQISDFEEVRSRIADLSGLRAGHVAIAISAELSGRFIHDQIAQYLAAFPHVTFDQRICAPDEFEPLLEDFAIDLAVAFQPNQTESYRTIAVREQQVNCFVPVTSALARANSLRLYALMQENLLMPATNTALRRIIDLACRRRGIALTSNLGLTGSTADLGAAFPDAIRFDVSIDAEQQDPPPGFRVVPLDIRDVPTGTISVGQLRQRTLPVAPAKFAEQLVRALAV